MVALLPRLILHFEEPDDFCKEAATNIEQVRLNFYYFELMWKNVTRYFEVVVKFRRIKCLVLHQ